MIPYNTIERGSPWVTPSLLRILTGNSPGWWRRGCAQCLYELKANLAPPWLAVLHSPQYCQADQLVETIMGINERSSDWLSFLSEKIKGSQCL